MRINERLRNNNISLEIYVFLLLNQVLGFYYFWVLSIVFCALEIIKKKGRIHLYTMPGRLAIIVLFVIGCIGGVVGLSAGQYAIWPFSRDIIYLSCIPLFWTVGVSLFYKYKDLKVIYSTVYFFCWTYSSINTLVRVISYVSSGNNGFSDFVENGGISSYLIAIGVYLAFFIPKETIKTYISPFWDTLSKTLIVLSFLLSFSRTSFIIILCLIMMSGLVQATSKTIRIILILIVSFVVVYSYIPSVINTFFDNISHSIEEISYKDTTWTSSQIVQNWRGYEAHVALDTFSRFNTWEFLFGKGFGYLLNVGIYAKLVTNEEALPFLHNGHITLLLKYGLVGLIVSWIYYAKMFFGIKPTLSCYEKNLIRGMTLSLVVASLFIMGIFVSGPPLCWFLILSWIYEMNRIEFNNSPNSITMH